jgi:hypothetical protein
MRVSKTTIYISISFIALAGFGCVRSETVVPQQPAANQDQQQAADQQPAYVEVQQAPPALLVETQPPAQSPDDVWISGYWNWTSQQYQWQAGHYSRRPQPDVAWVAPRYDAEAHRYTPGQWSKSGQRPEQAQQQTPDRKPDEHQDQNADHGNNGR